MISQSWINQIARSDLYFENSEIEAAESIHLTM